MNKTLQPKEHLKRKHKQSLALNDYEIEALDKYCRKYKVKNRAKFMREAIITVVLKQFDKDYPTLFDVSEISKQEVSALNTSN
jgi:hypothetical protein